MAGCPFFLPFIRVEQNVSPSIDYSSPAADQALVMDLEQYTAFIVVKDPDDTELTYIWSIDNFGVQGGATPLISGGLGSQITISRNAGYDGHDLSVIVYDSAGGSDQRSWRIEIPESTP